jgi:predicted ferric reductase
MKFRQKAVFWIIVYLVLVLSPFIILFLAPRPPGREFLREVAVAAGFAGLSLMGLQFIPTARLPFLAEVFPLDTLYIFHHNVSILSFVLMLAHPLLLVANNPYVLGLFNVFTAPLRAVAGVVALFLIIILVLSSVRREDLGIDYDVWHIAHDLLAVAAVGLTLLHIFRVDYYTAVPAQRILWIVMAVLWGGMLLYVRVVRPIILLQRPYEVVEVIEERGDSWSLVLKPKGHEGMTFRAGQVAWLTVWRSPFSFVDHPFSFTSSAENPERLAFTIKELGDFTSTIEEIPVGKEVYVDGPYGTFDIDHWKGSGYIFIAGGIGIAPVMSMLRTLDDRGDDRELLLFYGNPNWEDVIFKEEIREMQNRLPLGVVHVLENPPEGWQGETGFFNREILKRHIPFDCAECVYFVCGPLPMLDVVYNALCDLGVSRDRIHMEQYKMA